MIFKYNQKALENNSSANGGKAYQQCAMSVLDTIADPDITFDADGICNYYHEYKSLESNSVFTGNQGKVQFDAAIQIIKNDGRNKQYDCILGVSGGVDSTYLAWIAKNAGLRVLCIHFDNGWNSELAVKNIENIVQSCGFDLYTYVIDWPEFRDIQLSYFKANVIDIEAVTDIAIFSALDILCQKFNIKHIIDGRNIVTEAVLPPSWICKNHSNLRDIHKKFGSLPLKSFPLMSPWRRRYVAKRKPFENWQLLNFIPYNKAEAKAIIQKELNWRDYGGKHYESVFTRFYQGYILPEKFFVDKRKAHLSNLIFSGQITKNEALEELNKPIYPKELLQQDYTFVLKKLGFSENEFESYIQTEAVPHQNFAMSLSIFDEVPWLKLFSFIKK